MPIHTIKSKITQSQLKEIAQESYIEMVKGVVDVEQKIITLGGEMHADCEEILLKSGSKQVNLWGFNVYVDQPTDSRIQYTSLINIRPNQNNLKMEITDPKLQQKIKTIVDTLIE